MFQRLNTASTFIPPGKEKTIGKLDVNGTAVLNQRDVGEIYSLEKRVPDAMGRVFHPTILGHELIAAYPMMAILTARKKTSNAQPPACPFQPPKHGASVGTPSQRLQSQYLSPFL